MSQFNYHNYLINGVYMGEEFEKLKMNEDLIDA